MFKISILKRKGYFGARVSCVGPSGGIQEISVYAHGLFSIIRLSKARCPHEGYGGICDYYDNKRIKRAHF